MGDYKWIGLVRKFYNCSFYNDSNAVQMFLHIFLNAQREDKPYFDQITMRGQFRTSIKDIMQFLQVSRKSARRSLDKLKAAGIIHVVSLRRNGVLITVREFSKFLSLSNMREGWVKLYYDLNYQDFFEDAQTLHIYLHILLHSYSSNETYDDPLWFDFKKISSSTGVSFEGIKNSLQKLRKTGILNVGYNGQKKLSSVRLIDFSDYIKNTLPITPPIASASYAEELESPSELDILLPDVSTIFSEKGGVKTEQKKSKEGPKDSIENFSPDVYEISTSNSVNNVKTNSYKSNEQKEGQKTAQKSSKVEGTEILPNRHESVYMREHIIKENKDKRIENLYYNNYSHEQNFSSIEELVLDEEWVCSMQKLYGFSGKEALYTALVLFIENLKCRKEIVPKRLKEFLDYFCNWYKRNEKILRSKIKGSTSNDYGKELWDKCKFAFSKIVNDHIFETVFRPISFEKFDMSSKTLILRLPNKQVFKILEENYIDTLKVVFNKFFGAGVKLQYVL